MLDGGLIHSRLDFYINVTSKYGTRFGRATCTVNIETISFEITPSYHTQPVAFFFFFCGQLCSIHYSVVEKSLYEAKIKFQAQKTTFLHI